MISDKKRVLEESQMKKISKIVVLILIGIIGGMGGSIKQADTPAEK